MLDVALLLFGATAFAAPGLHAAALKGVWTGLGGRGGLIGRGRAPDDAVTAAASGLDPDISPAYPAVRALLDRHGAGH